MMNEELFRILLSLYLWKVTGINAMMDGLT